jgi:hypothetical protein
MSLHKHHPRNHKEPDPSPKRVIHPRAPAEGDCYVVKTGWPHCHRTFIVRTVNSRSFYVYEQRTGEVPGGLVRRRLSEWDAWTEELFEMGFIFLNGDAVLPPLWLPCKPGVNPTNIMYHSRFNEALKNAREILKTANIYQVGQSRNECRFKVIPDPGQVATVSVPDDEGKRIKCTCGVHQAGGTHSWRPCMHILAILLKFAELRPRMKEYVAVR